VEPEDNTTALLGQAYSRLGHQIVAGVVAAGYPQRPAHSAVFAHIDLAGTRLTALAARANVTPQAMGELVDDLQHLGYVRRVPDPSDRRAKLVTLTAKGQACVQAGLDTISGIEQHLEDLLGRRALVELRATLRRIIADTGTTGND
jgi:DNA-binding MarR family transcriptional regulator